MKHGYKGILLEQNKEPLLSKGIKQLDRLPVKEKFFCNTEDMDPESYTPSELAAILREAQIVDETDAGSGKSLHRRLAKGSTPLSSMRWMMSRTFPVSFASPSGCRRNCVREFSFCAVLSVRRARRLKYIEIFLTSTSKFLRRSVLIRYAAWAAPIPPSREAAGFPDAEALLSSAPVR